MIRVIKKMEEIRIGRSLKILKYGIQIVEKLHIDIKGIKLPGYYWMRSKKNRILKYLEKVGIALSVLLNVVLGGPSNQTFSARNYHWKRNNKFNLVKLIDFIIFWDSDHCLHSWLYWHTGKNIRLFGKIYLQKYDIEIQSMIIKEDNYENLN